MTFIYILLQLYTCIMMLIDTYQTKKILSINPEAEANPIIKWIYRHGQMKTVMVFKITISFIPFFTNLVGVLFLALTYSYVVYNNYTGFRDYEINNRIY